MTVKIKKFCAGSYDATCRECPWSVEDVPMDEAERLADEHQAECPQQRMFA